MGTLKGVERIYQQTFIDTYYSKIGFAKLYDRKTPVMAAELLNDRVLPFFEQQDIPLNRILTDHGTKNWARPNGMRTNCILAVENTDHTRTKTRHSQTNGICERFHKTMLNEFYRAAFRKRIYRTLEELQAEIDVWMENYNQQRPHQGHWCYDKTPLQIFLDSVSLAEGENLSGVNPVRTRCLSDAVLIYTHDIREASPPDHLDRTIRV